MNKTIIEILLTISMLELGLKLLINARIGKTQRLFYEIKENATY